MDEIPDKDKVIFNEPDETGLCSLTFFAFSTIITMKAASSQGAHVDYHAVSRKVIDLCRGYEWSLSRTLTGSDLYHLNHAKGETVEVKRQTWEAIESGLRFCEKSEGRFDITMGAITQLWDFNNEIVPDEDEIKRALPHVDWRRVNLKKVVGNDSTRFFIKLEDPEAVLDLGGCAKGFIADRMCELLQSEGIAHAFVNLGGNVAVFGGKPDGAPWRIGIKNPFDTEQIRGVSTLTNGSVVTSGLYERCFTQDDRFYHHILDVKTGRPIETDIAGVSVIANTSQDADGFSTTLFALGSEAAIRFAERTPGIEVIIITKDEKALASSGLADK